MILNQEVPLLFAQVIMQFSNEAILEGLRVLFCALCQNIIGRLVKADQLCNMDETGFTHNQNSQKVVFLKGYINVWSKSSDMNFLPDLSCMCLWF